jgi:hypothetical protein
MEKLKEDPVGYGGERMDGAGTHQAAEARFREVFRPKAALGLQTVVGFPSNGMAQPTIPLVAGRQGILGVD